jgi:hypothetical protein
MPLLPGSVMNPISRPVEHFVGMMRKYTSRSFTGNSTGSRISSPLGSSIERPRKSERLLGRVKHEQVQIAHVFLDLDAIRLHVRRN